MQRLTDLRSILCSFFLCSVLLATAASAQAVTPAAGYIYDKQVLADLTQTCVARAAGGTFVGQGPGFTGAGQSVVFVSESGAETVVASDFNSIGDCVYDAVADTLYVLDNALEVSGALTGDTVFAVPSASTASGLSAVGLELVAAGSIPDAFGVALDAAGDVFVSDATGSGLGSVKKISGGVMTDFIAGGLEFTGGLIFEPSGDLLVVESLPGFDNQVSRYDSTGTFQSIVSGPTFSHGSFDLELNIDGSVLVSGAFGGDVVALDASSGSTSSFAGGLTFASGIDVDPFTGRAQILSSTFTFPDPPEEDFSIHRFSPVDRLVAGNGNPARNCVSTFYGLELVPKKPGKPAKHAICVDGTPCDADGVVNDECLFPVGFCLNVVDAANPALAGCSSGGVDVFELKKTKPESGALGALAVEIQADAPISDTTCYFSDGIVVPVKIASSGKKKDGKGLVKTKVTSSDGKPLKDADTAKLVCRPAP